MAVCVCVLASAVYVPKKKRKMKELNKKETVGDLLDAFTEVCVSANVWIQMGLWVRPGMTGSSDRTVVNTSSPLQDQVVGSPPEVEKALPLPASAPAPGAPQTPPSPAPHAPAESDATRPATEYQRDHPTNTPKPGGLKHRYTAG